MRWLPVCAIALTAACSLPRWPVDAPISSPYGLRMVGWLPAVHRGVDLDAPEGAPVRAMADGRVRVAGRMSGFGNVVVIDHGRGIETLYAHLASIAVAKGDEVDGRQVIGRVGRTGNARGAHLHFEVRRGGRPQDPVPLLGGMPGR